MGTVLCPAIGADKCHSATKLAKKLRKAFQASRLSALLRSAADSKEGWLSDLRGHPAVSLSPCSEWSLVEGTFVSEESKRRRPDCGSSLKALAVRAASPGAGLRNSFLAAARLSTARWSGPHSQPSRKSSLKGAAQEDFWLLFLATHS
ncbi:hypothetical protein AAFF_G00253850 [Aldrovandia affinis]|uniref:Uncharacterized protein n=1 Tax=Aldrovandia affinis TaxID=143900 RepID=A0AAD7RCK2_9TELE|nr:hypothetical protein AAFF_G00253850 [Aldrovandia affinis]